jgi:hypothetical protein
MLNVIEEKIEEIRRVATTQTNQVCNELNSLADALQQAEARFSTNMRAASVKREEASKIEELALREHSTALSNILASTLAIVQQLDDGQMVTGSIEAPVRKPKIRAVAGE